MQLTYTAQDNTAALKMLREDLKNPPYEVNRSIVRVAIRQLNRMEPFGTIEVDTVSEKRHNGTTWAHDRLWSAVSSRKSKEWCAVNPVKPGSRGPAELARMFRL